MNAPKNLDKVYADAEKLVADHEKARKVGMLDKSKPLHVFHDPQVADKPIKTRNADWAHDYILDHSLIGGDTLHHEIHHPDGKVEKQSWKPGEYVRQASDAMASKNKFAFKN